MPNMTPIATIAGIILKLKVNYDKHKTMNKLELEFRRATGQCPKVEIQLQDHDEIIPDFLLVEKNDLTDYPGYEGIGDTLTAYREAYIKFLEDKITKQEGAKNR